MELIALPSLVTMITLFSAGYLAIIFEYFFKVNKTAVALSVAALCWTVYFYATQSPPEVDAQNFMHHVSDISQIIFFLMGAMTIVELIDAHGGFKVITDLVKTTSKRKMLWLICLTTFFLSAVLDNLTTTILMISLLRKLIPKQEERFLFLCMVVVAANAGGAWTPMGDVTTTMLWINGQLSAWVIVKKLFAPSVVSILIPLTYFTLKIKGKFSEKIDEKPVPPESGARLVLYLGIGALVFVPVFKHYTDLPPFMGVLFGLSVLWFVTDYLHHENEYRDHLRIPHILTKIDTSSILFFLGILLAVSSLQDAGILNYIAKWLDHTVGNEVVIASLIGIFSAIIDNVPLVAATMGMYPLEVYPMDSSIWQMIAYAAGTGGSLLIIGSSSGIALMGMEKVEFFDFMKKMTLPVLVGYLAGMGVYLLQG